ncbi:MAG: carbohydrate-binding protein [Candidatus Nealsonbacteria bacterium]|nr:carbohydrate-binding protein [Candidatus Nealsonbacteria bacterium]
MKFRLTVFLAVLVLPASFSQAVVIHLEAEDFKDGGEGVSYHDTDAVNRSNGQYRPSEGVDIFEMPENLGGGYGLSYAKPGEWFLMSGDTAPGPWVSDPVFPEAGNYIVRARVATDPTSHAGNIFHLEVDGAVVGIHALQTGGWLNFGTFTGITSAPISAGPHEVRFVADTDDYNINWIEFDSEIPPIGSLRNEMPAPAPEGGIGTMGIREVIDNGLIGSQDDCYESLKSGGGTIVDYTASVLNLHDNAGTGSFGGDVPFGVVNEQHRERGQIEHLSLFAQGTVRIPTSGLYTFGVNSDDGFSLLFPGHEFLSAPGDGIKAQLVALTEGKALTSWGGKGPSDVLGVIHLDAGNHPFMLTYHEATQGAGLELFAADGARTQFDGDFQLVGHPSGLQLVPEPSTLILLVIGAFGLVAYGWRRRK